jgi:hypothetical protein
MQSILQYKRFGRHARDQYERDKKRAGALERGNAENDVEGNANVQDHGRRPSSIDSKQKCLRLAKAQTRATQKKLNSLGEKIKMELRTKDRVASLWTGTEPFQLLTRIRASGREWVTS